MRLRTLQLGSEFLATVATCLILGCGGPEGRIEEGLEANVLFFVNFEKGVDAQTGFYAGSPLADFDGARTHHLLNGGVQDGCLAFEKDAGALMYAAQDNFPYSTGAWSGGVSFWLSVDTQEGLEADYPEPFHIGKREGDSYPWDDAVIFVDFTKPPRTLRFGCYPNKSQEISDEMVDQRVISVKDLGWKSDDWHHLVITWRNFNSGKADAEWAFFVDGLEVGRRRNLRQDLTWDMETQVLRYNHWKSPGKIDEIAIFSKMLTPGDAKYLYKPRRRLNVLLKKDR